MKKLLVYLEMNGKQVYIGDICCNKDDSEFAYSEDYINSNIAVPISISLPLQKEKFSTGETRLFFEGLLPEGFTRKTVAKWMHVSENDYISILAELGNECLGAIRIIDDKAAKSESKYEKLDEIISTTVYESSTRDMGVFIGGKLSIDDITCESFAIEAQKAGINERLARKRFEKMSSEFEAALIGTANELNEQGFYAAKKLCGRILKSGGYNKK